MEHNTKKWLLKVLSYVLVATLASGFTWFLADRLPNSKLEQMSGLIEKRFIAESDKASYEEAAAKAMVASLGDRWSSYISADRYQAHVDNQNNEFVGVGITIQQRQDTDGFDILQVVKDGPADRAGILPGDILTHADGQSAAGMDITTLTDLIKGKKNTPVEITVLRQGESLTFTVKRESIHQPAAESRMLEGNVGLVTIANFHTEAGEETIAQIRALVDQGAQALVFDVRNNPGGFVDELVEVLDYLLPEGALFRSIDYKGHEEVEESDADCLELPMAVLINGSSYSAAEFFAAALAEYDWAVTVGEPTVGKGYFQHTLELMDGSALYLSTGKYFTPEGVSLAEVGGLQPDIPVAPAQGPVTPEEDPQIRAAIAALENKN